VKAVDPGGCVLKGALRAAVVLPLAFALGEVVLDNHQIGLFAAFGSISLLVLVEFGGSIRARLAGYAGLALTGAALIGLGTLCSHSTGLGAVAMFLVGFGILFAGVLNGYVAAFLERAIAALLAGEDPPPALAREAFAAGQLLDGGLRDYLSDRSGATAPIEELGVLMAGAARVREVAGLLSNPEVLVMVEPVDPRLHRVQAARRELEAERDRRCEWFAALGDSIARRGQPPGPEPPGAAASEVVLERLPGGEVPPGLAIAWAHRYLAASVPSRPP
jgi:hypothetical protein